MNIGPAGLGYLLIGIIASFGGLIFFTLRYRKVFLAANLELNADQIWRDASVEAEKAGLKKSDLLYGIWQDLSPTLSALVVKDVNNKVVGRVEFTMGSRAISFQVGDQAFQIHFLPTWSTSASLNAVENINLTLATYSVLNIVGRHQFDIREYGKLVSERKSGWIRNTVHYRNGDRLIGMTQEISPRMKIGKLAIFPSEMPIHIRCFILAL